MAAQLSERGWAVGLLPPGVARYDLMAVRDGRKIAVQVKASQGGVAHWLNVPEKLPSVVEVQDEWFVLVALNDLHQPDFYVVPAYVALVFARLGLTNAKSPAAGKGNLKARDFYAYKDGWDLVEGDCAKHADKLFAFRGGFWDWADKHGATYGVDLTEQHELPTDPELAG